MKIFQSAIAIISLLALSLSATAFNNNESTQSFSVSVELVDSAGNTYSGLIPQESLPVSITKMRLTRATFLEFPGVGYAELDTDITDNIEKQRQYCRFEVAQTSCDIPLASSFTLDSNTMGYVHKCCNSGATLPQGYSGIVPKHINTDAYGIYVKTDGISLFPPKRPNLIDDHEHCYTYRLGAAGPPAGYGNLQECYENALKNIELGSQSPDFSVKTNDPRYCLYNTGNVIICARKPATEISPVRRPDYKHDPALCLYLEDSSVCQANSVRNAQVGAYGYNQSDSSWMSAAFQSGSEATKILIAANPSISNSLLAIALQDASSSVREAAAGNPNISSEQLNAALSDQYEVVRIAAAANPSMTVAMINAALSDPSTLVKVSAVSNQNTTVDILNSILHPYFGSNTPVLRAAAAANPNIDETGLSYALQSGNIPVREAAAGNPNMTYNLLRTMAVIDGSATVREIAAQHPNLTGDALAVSISDVQIQVRESAAYNANTSQTQLAALLNDQYVTVKYAVARNPSISSSLLDSMLFDSPRRDDINLRMLAVVHANTTPSTLSIAYNALGEYSTVKAGILRNPNTPSNVLDQAIAGNDVSLKAAAASNINASEAQLNALRQSNYTSILVEIAKNVSASSDVLAAVYATNDVSAQIQVAANPSASIATLTAAMNSNDVSIKMAAAGNPMLSRELLIQALNDSSSSVQLAAIKNPHATPSMILSGAGNEYNFALAGLSASFVNEHCATDISSVNDKLSCFGEILSGRGAPSSSPAAAWAGVNVTDFISIISDEKVNIDTVEHHVFSLLNESAAVLPFAGPVTIIARNDLNQSWGVAQSIHSSAATISANSKELSFSKELGEIFMSAAAATFEYRAKAKINCSISLQGETIPCEMAVLGSVFSHINDRSAPVAFLVYPDEYGVDVEYRSAIPNVLDYRLLSFNIIDPKTDTLTATATIDSLRLKGGGLASTENLTYSEIESGKYQPGTEFSVEANAADYIIEITVSDTNGNSETYDLPFSYAPYSIELGQITIPSGGTPFVTSESKNAINSAIDVGGQPITGTYYIDLTVSPSATVTPIISGTPLSPGQTLRVHSNYDFDIAGSVVDIPVAFAYGDSGLAPITIKTGAPTPKTISATLSAWAPDFTYAGPATVALVVEPTDFSVTLSDSHCAFGKESSLLPANVYDPKLQGLCRLRVDGAPNGLAVSYVNGVAHYAGKSESPGMHSLIAYIDIYNGDNQWVQVASKPIGDLTVTIPNFTLGARNLATQYVQVLEEIDIELKEENTACRMTTMSAYNIDTNFFTNYSQNSVPFCIIDIAQGPSGLNLLPGTFKPYLYGRLDDAGALDVVGSISLIAYSGTIIPINDSTMVINSVPPPVPSMKALTYNKVRAEEELYSVPVSGGFFQRAVISSINTDLIITVEKDGEITKEMEKPKRLYTAQPMIEERADLVTEAANVWQEEQWSVKAAYKLAPQIATTWNLTSVRIPQDSVKPSVDLDTLDVILNSFNVKINIQDTRTQEPFDASRDGLWEVKLANVVSSKNIVDITGYHSVDSNGEVTITADISGHEQLKVVAIARLVSSIPELAFERQSRAFDVINPIPPETAPIVHLLDINRASSTSELYAVPVEGGFFQRAYVFAENSDLNITITKDGEVFKEINRVSAYSLLPEISERINLLDNASTMWKREQWSISAKYRLVPDEPTVINFETVRVPMATVIPELTIPSVAMNTDALIATVTVKDKRSDNYDPNQHGQWRVKLVNYVGSDVTEDLTPYTDIDENGSVTFSTDISGKRRLRIVAIAELVSELPDLDYTRKSKTHNVRLFYGDAIDAELSNRAESGRVPFSIGASIRVIDRDMFRSIGNVQWMLSKDGSDFVKMHEGESSRDQWYGQTLTEVGTYKLKAIIENKYSGLTTETAAVEYHAYKTPEIVIDGPTAAFVGEEKILTATVTDENGDIIPSDELDIVWEEGFVNKAIVGTGPTLTVTSASPTVKQLYARAQFKYSPDSASNSWDVSRHPLRFYSVSPVYTGVTGPRISETEKDVTYKGNANPPYPGLDNAIVSYFQLSDGSQHPGTELTFKPAAGKSNETVLFVSYFEGYEAETKSISKVTLTLWDYIWPQWSLSVKSKYVHAPTVATAMINSASSTNKIAGLSFEWIVPEGVTILDDRIERQRSFMFNTPGQYNIQVKVTDDRGHESIESEIVNVQQPEPFEIGTLDLIFNGKNTIEPLNVYMRATAKVGHSADSVANYRFYIDGEMVTDGPAYQATKTFMAGDHTVKVVATSGFGLTAEAEKTISVLPNLPPQCSPVIVESNDAYIFNAKCTDDNGYVAKYEWSVDGTAVERNHYTLYVMKRINPSLSNTVVTLTATDKYGNSKTYHDIR